MLLLFVCLVSSLVVATNQSQTNSNTNETRSQDYYGSYDDDNRTHNVSLAEKYIKWMNSVVEYRWQDRYNVVFVIGVIPALSAVASIGNLMVLIVASVSSQFRTVSCIFLTNLSAIDVALILIVPFKVLETFVIKFPFNEFWICKFVYTMREALYICYVHTFMLIAVERYIVVVYPMKAMHICTKKRARLAICTIWLLSFLFAIPTWFHFSLIGADHGWPVCARDIIRRSYPNINVDLWRKIHESYSLFLLYVLPLTALAICYSVIAVALYRSIKSSHLLTKRAEQIRLPPSDGSMNSTTTGNSLYSNRQRRLVPDLQRERILVLKMCVVLVVLFGVCQGPWRIQYWLNVVKPDLVAGDINNKLNAPFFALCVFNSALNPVIYGFMSRNFRQAFSVAVAKWCMVPIEVYTRSVLRWLPDQKQSNLRKRSEQDGQLRKSVESRVAGNNNKASEIDLPSKSSSSQRNSSTDKLVATIQQYQHLRRNNAIKERCSDSRSVSEPDTDLNKNVALVIACDEPAILNQGDPDWDALDGVKPAVIIMTRV